MAKASPNFAAAVRVEGAVTCGPRIRSDHSSLSGPKKRDNEE